MVQCYTLEIWEGADCIILGEKTIALLYADSDPIYKGPHASKRYPGTYASVFII